MASQAKKSVKEFSIFINMLYKNLFTYIFKLITGKVGMGHGDFKLFAMFGAWLGWQLLPLIILLASLVGSILGISLMLVGLIKREKPIPFGMGITTVRLSGPRSRRAPCSASSWLASVSEPRKASQMRCFLWISTALISGEGR